MGLKFYWSHARIAGPIKNGFAQIHSLNYEEMLSDGNYKEIYR